MSSTVCNVGTLLFLLILMPNTNGHYEKHQKDASTNVKSGECPDDWSLYERTKSCFYVIEKRLRWSEAEDRCVKYGGHLASIIDEYENQFAFNVAKRANLSTPTLWLGRLVALTKSGAYQWNDGSIGRHSDGFRGEPPSGTDRCLTMWLDFDTPDGSWNEWDCNYFNGYSALCKTSIKHIPKTEPATVRKPPEDGSYISHRCCLSSSCEKQCATGERCIPDDLDCWTKNCTKGGLGWCLPIATN